MIDLHIHSTYSDGSSTIEEILEKAEALGLKQIAITDHNVLEGSIKAKSLSKTDFIVGTELSVGYSKCEVHLLAYFPKESDYKNVLFILKESEAFKTIAHMEMIERLNEQGIDITLPEVKSFAHGTVNRVHICNAMMKKGYIHSVQEGFEKYVGDHCPAYVERKVVTLEEACEAIHKDNGIAVIAHPYEYDALEPIDSFLEEIIDMIDGIECFHPSATPSQRLHLKDIAQAHNKIVTGGSDYHGSNKPDISLNMMEVEDRYSF